MPLISVVLCTYRRERLALRAVQSVMRQEFGDFELLVVDQDPARRLERELAALAPGEARLHYELCPQVGLSHARNHGVARSRAPYLVFLDDDACALPGWLRAYADAFDGPARAAMVGGRLLPEWERPKPRWYPSARLSQLGLYDIGAEMRPFPELDLPIGANFGVRRDALCAAGGFDPSLGYSADNPRALGGEDSLVAARVRRQGGLILYQPGAAVTHLVRRDKLSFRAFLRRGFQEGRTQIAFTVRTQGATPEWLRGAAQWHAKRVLKTPLRLAVDLWRRGFARSETLGESVAQAVLSAGVVYECRQMLSLDANGALGTGVN